LGHDHSGNQEVQYENYLTTQIYPCKCLSSQRLDSELWIYSKNLFYCSGSLRITM